MTIIPTYLSFVVIFERLLISGESHISPYGISDFYISWGKNPVAMKKVTLALLLSCFSLSLMGGIEPYPGAGARAVGLGYAYTGIRGDWGTVFFNPAGIGGLTGPSAGVYFEQRFMLRELTYGSAGAIYPWDEGNQALGLEIRTFGFDAFRQNQIGLAYSITLLDKISLGAKAKYANLNILDHGTAGVFLIDAGVHLQFSEELSAGFWGQNLNRAEISTTLGGVEQTPTVVSAGLTYRPTDEFLLTAEVLKEETNPLTFRGGLEYRIGSLIYTRLGVGSQPLLLTGGLGVHWEGLQLDFAYSYTEQFSSPHLSLSYQF